MGGYQHIQAILELFRLACAENEEKCYFHVITGQDFLCKSKNELFTFFSNNNCNNYMSCSDADNNHFRYRTFYRNDWINYKSVIGKFATKAIYVIQRCLLIDRKPPLQWRIFKGMVYLSVTDEYVRYVLDFLKTKKGKKYFNWIKWCFIPEEFFFQTIAMNTKFADTVVNRNYRFALWKEKHGTQPGILDEEDYSAISESGAFFARKISSSYSSKLLDIYEV